MNLSHLLRPAVALALLLGVAVGCSPSDNAGAKANQDDDSKVVARFGDKTITMAEVKAEVVGELQKLEQERHKVIKNKLDEMINLSLANAEAEKQGLTLQELLEAEVGARIIPSSPEQIAMFYEQRKGQMQGRTMEQMTPDIVEYLRRQQVQTIQAEYIDNLRATADAKIFLDVPRIDLDIPEVAMSKGSSEAPVTLVEFADFECGYCRRVHPVVERLLSEYGDALRYTFVDYPLEMHKRAIPASVAARCADDQDKFWEYHENLMVMRGDLSDEDLKKRAESLELDLDLFASCMTDSSHAEAVDQLFDLGQKLGVTGTPTFFINGRMVEGAKSYDDLKSVIDEEIERGSTAS